jgi:hypothetical protein
MPRPQLRILFQRDFATKGITWSRQHVHRKVKAKEFPPPDGKTSDAPGAPNWWWESSIDKFLRNRAAARRKQATAIRDHAAVMRQRSAAVHAARRASLPSNSETE